MVVIAPPSCRYGHGHLPHLSLPGHASPACVTCLRKRPHPSYAQSFLLFTLVLCPCPLHLNSVAFGARRVQDVVAISARPYGQRAVLKFAQYTGCLSIAGRFTPGTFTNQITKQFREPRLLIITDPRPDAQVP